MVALQKENIETAIKLGIQLKMKRHYLKEKAINQNQVLVENQFNQVLLSFFFPELIEEEELLF
jgi:hypothetical protein